MRQAVTVVETDTQPTFSGVSTKLFNTEFPAAPPGNKLVQPFWALPIVSIGGLSVREMMGYCLLALLIAFPLFGLALLVF